MYNYIYGTKKQILENPINFLIFVKRLLPKYVNSLPDTAVVSFYEILKNNNKNSNGIVETGVGASTVILFFFSYYFKKKLYTFDFNPDKISLIRKVIIESICLPLNININKYWQPIASDSLDKYTGIRCLKEFKKKVNFGFFDSAHSLNHLIKEIDVFCEISTKNFIIGIDDGEKKDNREFHYDYVNMIRNKIGLKNIKNPTFNKCNFFYKEIETYLKKSFKKTEKIKTFFEKNFKNDLYFNYFGNDISYVGIEDKKKIDNFKYKNIFTGKKKGFLNVYKNRICFFKIKR